MSGFPESVLFSKSSNSEKARSHFFLCVLFVFQAARQKLKKEYSASLGMIRILIKCGGRSSGWNDYFYLAVQAFLCYFVLRHQDKTNIIFCCFFVFLPRDPQVDRGTEDPKESVWVESFLLFLWQKKSCFYDSDYKAQIKVLMNASESLHLCLCAPPQAHKRWKKKGI